MKSWASWKSLCIIAGTVLATLSWQACNPSSSPFPDVSTQVYLDTTGTVVNLDSLRNELTKFQGKTVKFERRATCAGCIVDVEVTRISKTDDIDPDAGPSTPRQIALFKNTDARDTTEMYHFEPGKTYVLQIGAATPGGPAVYSMIELSSGRTGRLRVVASGHVVGCLPKHVPGWSKVGFANCTDHAWGTTFRESALTDFGPLKAMIVGAETAITHRFRGEMAERTAWFSCDYGCCTA